MHLSPKDFTFVNTFLYGSVNELHLMPLMVMACFMCPKDVETTFYALVLAVINAGYLISYWTGGLFTIWLGISSTDFSKFWILITISSAWPLLTLLYLFFLPKENELGVKGMPIIESPITNLNRSTALIQTNIRDSFNSLPESLHGEWHFCLIILTQYLLSSLIRSRLSLFVVFMLSLGIVPCSNT